MESSTSSTLCARCRSLFEDISKLYEQERFTKVRRTYPDDEAPQKSAGFGCLLCNALDYDMNSSEEHIVNVSKDDDYVHLTLEYFLDGGYGGSVERRFVLPKVELDRKFFSLGEQACAATNTGDPRVLNLVGEWITRCQSHHRQCNWVQQPPRYPTRLLDVETDLVRLVESRTHNLSGPYATLSHSWGKRRVKVLTQQTLSEFCRGIHIDDIPPTFRDAIRVAQHLKIRYFWIDCYCIIQSDGGRNADQQLEIAQMGEIYSNAMINIGANNATSPLDGCFVARRPAPPVHILFAPASCSRREEYLLYEKDKPEAASEEFKDPKGSSVFGRAWCLQERLLCPRMVHFGRSAVFWECEDVKLVSDLVPFEYSKLTYGHALPFSLTPHRSLKPTVSTVRTPFMVHADHWKQIVSKYSTMELSFPTEDKLVACGGVAKRMAHILHDEYVAGFFRHDLVSSLTWTRAEVTAQRAQIWRAPSWSWASMDGGIDFSYSYSEAHMDAVVVSVDSRPVDPANPYGALEHAIITLKGMGVDVIAEPDADRVPRRWTGSKTVQCVRVQWDEGKASIEITFDDLNETGGGYVLFFTHVRPFYDEDAWVPEYHGRGLVLKALGEPTSERQEFVRIGAMDDTRFPQELFAALRHRTVTIR